MKIVKNILTKNPCYKAGKRIQVKGLMLHSVGCPQSKASAFINSWNRESYDSACVHAFIDGNDGTVYQTLPWEYFGWHCGGTGNSSYLGVEMCEPDCIQYVVGARFICYNEIEAKAVVRRTYQSAVELFAYLCNRYNLDPLKDGVILSHSEGYRRGIAANHGDPEHLWNGLGMDYTMDGFRQDVREAMESKKEVTMKEKEKYLVKVNIPDLNIRKGPGTDYQKTGKYTGIGTFTIVEESDGIGAEKWGRLKSGVGWIPLDYAKKLA
ncbi:MAG: peptidoglycan recognition family protein [Schaedlerella sp.]|nr:peptidoglycan recognition family protein [Schaedlerella sp.]